MSRERIGKGRWPYISQSFNSSLVNSYENCLATYDERHGCCKKCEKTFVFDCLRCSLLCCQVFISLAYQTGQISSSKSLNAVRASIRVPLQQIITLFSPWSCWTMPEELFETVCVQSVCWALSMDCKYVLAFQSSS